MKDIIKYVLKMFGLLKPHYLRYFICIPIYIAQTFIYNYIISSLLSKTVEAIEQGDRSKLTYVILTCFAGFMAVVLVASIGTYLLARSTLYAASQLRKMYLYRVMHLPVEEIRKKHTGEWSGNLFHHAGAPEGCLGDQLMWPLQSIFLILASSIVIFRISIQLGITCIFIGALGLTFNLILTTYREKVWEVEWVKRSVEFGALSDIITGSYAIRIFGIGGAIKKKYIEIVDTRIKLFKKSLNYESLNDAFSAVLNILFVSGVTGYGIILVNQKVLDFAALAMVMGLGAGLYQSINNLGRILSLLREYIMGVKLAYDVVEQPSEEEIAKEKMKEAMPTVTSAPGENAISFENVTFQYKKYTEDTDEKTDTKIQAYNDAKVLENINLIVGKGKTVAFVGESGSGKSTLHKLMIHLYHADQGDIFVFGKNIKQYSIHELRKLISYTPQDSWLFDDTIKENIRIGKLDATDDEIIEAAKMAYAHAFIEEFPDGYETRVGERGIKVSGGQRQRIALARAFLKNTPIILLDEATSALDNKSEEEIRKAILALSQGKTVIIAAHRLTTVLHADEVYVFEKGCVAESGSHEELIARNGVYKRLYDTHVGKAAMGHVS